MAELSIGNTALGSVFRKIMLSDSIEPGTDPSYELCKLIYLYHPLGAKMAEAPITKAMSKPRRITVPDSPEEDLRKAFQEQWKEDRADEYIRRTAILSRVYGIASVAMLVANKKASEAIDMWKLAKLDISFNVFDPLNTSGSLVLSQIPTEMDFMHTRGVTVNGETFHRSRSCVLMNEGPIYLSYTTSAFGFVGRSVYQRALYPLKSFIQSMVTDDMVTRKAGLIVAKIKQAGSIVDNLMMAFASMKRNLLKQAQTDNVISIDPDESIETLDMKNLDGAYTVARKNILENIAASDDMPAIILNNETFAEGFGEGSEDAKYVAEYIDRKRGELEPLYKFFDQVVQFRAWNEDFYKSIQTKYPEQYGKIDYRTAFYSWVNAFHAEWPSMIEEPESEKIKVDDTKLKALTAIVEVIEPKLDPANRATLIQWLEDNVNEMQRLFPSPLMLDYEALEAYEPQELAMEETGGDKGPNEPKPFAAQDSVVAASIPRLPRRRAMRG